VPQELKLSQAVVEHCCYLIAQKLEDTNEISITAAHCAKTIIIAATSGHRILEHCVKMLMPGMVHYIAGVAGSLDGEEANPQDVHVRGVEETLKAFVAFFDSVSEDYRARLLGVLFPLAILLLDPSRSPLTTLHGRTVTHLLSFATTSPTAFKDATGKLDAGARETLETSIRQALGNKGNFANQTAKPQISLRSF